MAMSKSGDLNLIWWNLERSLLQLAVHPRRAIGPRKNSKNMPKAGRVPTRNRQSVGASNIAAAIEGLVQTQLSIPKLTQTRSLQE